MKVESQFLASRQTALSLKVTGIVLLLGVLVDYLVLALPLNLLNSGWVVTVINEWVGRGTLSLLGVAFVVFGVWIDRTTTENNSRSGLLLATLIFSLLLGILFLLFVPLQFNSSRLASAEQTRQINQQADVQKQQLDALLAQQRARVTALLSNDQQVAQLEQELDNAQLPPDQQAQVQQVRETLEKVQADPKLLDQEVEKARTQGLEKIKQQQQQQLEQAQTQMRNSRNLAAASSALLAIGYFVIGGTGLSVVRSGGSHPKATRSKKRRKSGGTKV
ncbi:hypothetical protein IFO70_00840 [Phormidium tenue FACHB-886]|nr:hypothetical protein [Phormidium tenue FACHB-886]